MNIRTRTWDEYPAGRIRPHASPASTRCFPQVCPKKLSSRDPVRVRAFGVRRLAPPAAGQKRRTDVQAEPQRPAAPHLILASRSAGRAALAARRACRSRCGALPRSTRPPSRRACWPKARPRATSPTRSPNSRRGGSPPAPPTGWCSAPIRCCVCDGRLFDKPKDLADARGAACSRFAAGGTSFSPPRWSSRPGGRSGGTSAGRS